MKPIVVAVSHKSIGHRGGVKALEVGEYASLVLVTNTLSLHVLLPDRLDDLTQVEHSTLGPREDGVGETVARTHLFHRRF